MLYRLEQLIGMAVWADDGEIGRIRDVRFEGAHWAVRCLVCDAGGWLGGRKVLIAPATVESLNWAQGQLHVRLTRQQVQEGPGADPHLRSAKAAMGCHLATATQSIGHLKEFLIDVPSWAIRYVVIDTRNWWPGKQVVIPPQWITQLDCAAHIATVDVDRATVQDAPEYDPQMEFTPRREANFHRHHRRPAYWR